MAERDAEQIQRDIERARVALGTAVDEIAYRTNPKRVADNAKTTLKQRAQTSQGKAVIAGAGVLLTLLIVRRVRRHKDIT